MPKPTAISLLLGLAALGAIAAAPREARADSFSGPGFAYASYNVYTPSSGYCVSAEIGIESWANGAPTSGQGQSIRIYAGTEQLLAPACNLINEAVPYHQMVLSYALYQWNGSSAVVCGNNPGAMDYDGDYPGNKTVGGYNGVTLYTPGVFFFSPPTPDIYVGGCGPGWYLGVAYGQEWNGSAWVGGTVQTPWAYLDVP